MNNETRMPPITPWPSIVALFLVGAGAATLAGKVPVALPVLREDLSLSLSQAGLTIAIFSLIAAFFGALFGAIADRFGAVRIAILGLSLAACASAAGAFAQSAMFLLITRVVEGVGFYLASTSIPALMLRLSHPSDRQKAMGLWGAFLPAGTALIVISGGPLVTVIGWRGLWLLIAVLLVMTTLIIRISTRHLPGEKSGAQNLSFAGTYKILQHRGPLLMALVFVAYSAQFLAVTAFIPLILVEEHGWLLSAAGLAGGLVIGANVVGNVASGVFLDMGIRRRTVLLSGAAGMAIGAILLLAAPLSLPVKLAGGAMFTITGGLIPGALFAGTSVHAPTPKDVSTLNGLLLQGAAIGQLVGPPIAVWFAQATGSWSGALWFTLPAAMAAALFAIKLGTLETREQTKTEPR